MRSKEEQIIRIDELTENLSMAKYNLLKISTLIRLLEESWNRKQSCTACSENINALDEMIEQIDKLDDIEVREPYEKKFNLIRKHFHQKHKFTSPGFYVARWTLMLLIIGGVITSIVSLALVHLVETNILIGGLAISLNVGYAVGSVKEGKQRKAEKIV